MDAVAEVRQVENYDVLKKEIRVGISIYIQYNSQKTYIVFNRPTDLLRNTHYSQYYGCYMLDWIKLEIADKY
jgi:hypothetical protein